MTDTRTMDGRGRVTVPPHILKKLGVRAGDRIDFIVKDGVAILMPVGRPDPVCGEATSND